MANRTVTLMKEHVGAFLHDTSTSFYTIVLRWIDDKYKDIWSRMDWSASINENYTFATVASQAAYDLPLDLEHELACVNTTDGKRLCNLSGKLKFEYYRRLNYEDLYL